MSVEVSREPECDGPTENCAICYRPTAYWFTPKDVACCRDCALRVDADDIPNKAEWIRAVMSRLGRKP